MGELANCPRCGSVFVRQLRDLCENCYKEEDKQFKMVYAFLRKRANRNATVPEIVEATGVRDDIVYKFIRDKRLHASQFSNISYPCAQCGTAIQAGKLCHPCSSRLNQELKDEQRTEATLQKKKTEQGRAYFSQKEK